MSFTETTLVVRGDIDSTAATCLATSVSDAATNGKLLIQHDGAVLAGNNAGALNGLIKLTAAHPQPDGSTAILTSSEFLRSDVKNIHYSRPATGNTQVITVGNLQAGMNSIRLEAKNGVEVYDVLGVTGINATEIVANFTNRADTERFKNVTMAVSGSNVQISVGPRGSDTIVTGDDALTVSVSSDNNGRKGQQDNVIALENRAYTSAGAYNQYEFPIVVPKSATVSGADYGIYTIEIEKTLPGRRKINEVISVCIADDEGDTNLLEALETALGSAVVDTTPPTGFTAASFTDNAGTGVTTYVIASDDAIYATLSGAFASDANFGTIVLSSSGAEADVTVSVSVDAVTARIVDLGVTASDYADGVTLTITATQTDLAGNVSAADTDTAAISAS